MSMPNLIKIIKTQIIRIALLLSKIAKVLRPNSAVYWKQVLVVITGKEVIQNSRFTIGSSKINRKRNPSQIIQYVATTMNKYGKPLN